MLQNVNFKVRADLLLAHYICRYNMSFLFAEKLPNIMKHIAFDSNILEVYSTNRRRLQKIIKKVLLIVKRKKLSQYTKENPYSI